MSRFTENNNDQLGGKILSIPVDSSDPDTSSNVPSGNINNTVGETATALVVLFIVLIVLYIIFIVVTIMAFSKTSNETLKVFLILGIFLPPIAPITFIIALMIIFGGLK